MSKIYDVIVLGGGPAGLSAGLYAARAKMSVLVLEKSRNGGQIVTTNEVANYPGGIDDETGPSLIDRMVKQCERFGAELKKGSVVDVALEGDIKTIKTQGGDEYQARAVIIATGASPRKLGCPGEAVLTGKGVSYCATCDGDFFTDLEVYAIGGGDTAFEEGGFLTKFARKVTIVHRGDEGTAAKSIIAKAKKNEKLNFMANSEVVAIKGEGIVESMVIRNQITGEETEIHAKEEDGTFGIFIFIGYIPQTDLFKGKVTLDDYGYVVADENMNTSIPGVFAAGDVRVKQLRQVVTATGDGALASIMAERYIEKKFH